MNIQKKQDESDQLTQQLKMESSYPDQEFKKKLFNKMIKKHKSRALFFNIFTMTKTKWKIATLFTCLFLVVITTTGSLSGGYLLYRRWQSGKNYTETLKGNEKEEILTNVLRSNPQSSISAQPGVGALTASTTLVSEDDKALVAQTGDPEFRNYNFSHAKSTVEFGPAASSCEVISSYDFMSSMEVYEYYDNDNKFRFSHNTKMISHDKDGNIVIYMLMTEDEHYTYYGGEYAVKMVTDAIDLGIDSEVIEEIEGELIEDLELEEIEEQEMSPDEMIEQTFGDDVTVEKVVEDGETKYFIISRKEYMPCSLDDIQSEEYSENSITRTWIDANTNSIVKEEYYLDEVSDDNLLVRTDSIVENSQVASYDEVKEHFEFEFEVEVREIEWDFPDPFGKGYLENLETQLQEEPITALIPTDKDWSVSSAYSTGSLLSIDRLDYMQDRDFYASTETGEKMYQLMTSSFDYEQWIEPKLDMSFYYNGWDDQPEITSFSIEIYDTKNSNEEILETISYGGDISEATSNVDISIDGNEVSVQKHISTKSLTYTEVSEDGEENEITDPVL